MENIIYIIIGLVGAILAMYLILFFLRRGADRKRSLEMVFLRVHVPKKEAQRDKDSTGEQFIQAGDFHEVVAVMAHLFKNLHSIYSDEFSAKVFGQDFISLEYAVIKEKVLFYVVVPKSLMGLVEKQITSLYPDSFVEKEDEYNFFHGDAKTVGCYMNLSKADYIPFKTYDELKTDSLNTIVNSLSKMEEDEGAGIQIILRPVRDGWQKKGNSEVENIRNGKSTKSLLNPISWISTLFELFATGEKSENSETASHQTSGQDEKIKSIENKSSSCGFEVCVRLVASSRSLGRSKSILRNMQSSFSQFNSPNLNSFVASKHHLQKKLLTDFIYRYPKNKMILGVDELASLYHFPNIRFNRSPNLDWQRFKIAPPPDNLAKEGLFLGTNTYRGKKTPVFVKNEDRFRHFYVIGQTGTGKSSILQTMLHQDFHNGKGVCVIDPHGSLIEDLLPHIPRSRSEDIIYFNPADTERPMGLNMLEAESDDERDLIALDAMNIMIKLFDEETFGPRIQDYFRNGCLTLMADPDGGALTDVVRLFSDDDFQKYKVAKVKNPIVRSFWENQMAKTGAREKAEIIPYFAAKFGAFITNTLMRNIVGQTKSAFDVTKVMQEEKILLINLSKGLVGDINSKLLGLMIVNKIQVAALRRQRMAKEDRKDFFLYIDEFQNYITDSIESILSEARKYRLGLNLAHQYLDQLTDERGNEKIKKAVFGNVGTMMAYKIGAQDGEYMQKEFDPTFSENDLTNLDAFKTAIKLSIDTQPSVPFSMEVQKPWEEEWLKKYPRDESAAEIYKEISRLKYGRDVKFVSREIERRIGV